LFKIFSKRKKEKKESCSISNAAKKNKSRSRINEGFLAWFFGKKTMTKNCAAGLCLWRLSFAFFYVGFVRWPALLFLRTFFLLYFFGFVSVVISSTETNSCICFSVFVFLSFVFLYFVVNEKSTADFLLLLLPCDPTCAFGLLGEGGNGLPRLKE
jgi:hypothetical protein